MFICARTALPFYAHHRSSSAFLVDFVDALKMFTPELMRKEVHDDVLSPDEEKLSSTFQMLDYLDAVMLEFRDQPVVYRQLSETMGDYKAHRLDAPETPSGPSSDPRAVSRAIQLMQKVKTRYDTATYKEFLDVLGRHNGNTEGVETNKAEGLAQVTRLFRTIPISAKSLQNS
ncbi:hypothetical protein CPB85DRAFT_226101 [Mucidula mucida]|nr:hypothetical protein CPB85DRAFT_226101 [Mucidula mucida]